MEMSNKFISRSSLKLSGEKKAGWAGDSVWKRLLVVVKRLLKHIFNTNCHDLWMEFLMKHTFYPSDNIIAVERVSMESQSTAIIAMLHREVISKPKIEVKGQQHSH